MKTLSGTQKLDTALLYLTTAMLVLVPFHAVLTVWLASNFGHYTAFRLWIEALIAILLCKVAYLLLRHKVILTDWRARWLWRLSGAYVALHIVLGVIALSRHEVNLTALGDGLVLNLRPIVIFWLAVAAAQRTDWLHKHWQQLLLWPALLVVVFGLAQHFLLPVDFLRHLGYGSRTILPYETVDQKLTYVRILSTFRGANPLGAYLVLVVTALTALGLSIKKPTQRLLIGLYMLATLVVLFFTYSRSAWLGALLSTGCVVWFAVREHKTYRYFVMAIVALVLVVAIGVATLRHNSRFENTIFHTDKISHSATSSNQDHLTALKSGVRDIVHNPIGHGPGTAGPASAHNNHPVRIAEDYYIQLGQEVGLLGVALFVLINILLGVTLWRRQDLLARILFTSLLGLTVINFVSHAWTDDTLAVLWWALAGIATAGVIIKTPHETQKVKEKATV